MDLDQEKKGQIQRKRRAEEQSKDLSGNVFTLKYNNAPNAKNYSNCDISGSFYEVSARVLDISGNVLKKLR
jgi:hypothetical protein